MACCVFDKDIFDLPTSLSLTRHLSQTRGISLSADDDDDSRVISKVLMKLTSGGVERERVQQANLAQVCHRLNNAAIIDSVNRQTISWICWVSFVKRKREREIIKKKTSLACAPQSRLQKSGGTSLQT